MNMELMGGPVARTRLIKPSFYTNEELAELEPLNRILFQGLWCFADREGRLEDRPKRLKTQILPYDDCDIELYLNRLQEKKFILRYEVDGVRYIQILNFKKHQHPHQQEQASTIPPPPNNIGTTSEQHPNNIGTNPSLTLNPLTSSFNLEREDSTEGKPSAPPSPPFLTYPTVGNGKKEWTLTEAKVKEYEESYPGVNIRGQAKVARQWCIDNPGKRKTQRGMPAFLSRWFAREQNRGGNGNAGVRRDPKLGYAQGNRSKWDTAKV